MIFTKDNIGELWISRDKRNIHKIVKMDPYNNNVVATYEDGDLGAWSLNGMANITKETREDLFKQITPEKNPEYFL